MFFDFSFTQKKQASTIWNCPIDLYFFYLFLLSFTIEIRKVVWFFPIKDSFNEYSGVYIYFSDLFLFFAILLWGILILKNKSSYLSIKSLVLANWKKKYNVLNLSVFSVPLALFFWSLLSVFWSENKIISLYRSAKFFESYLLLLYVALRFFPYFWLYIEKNFISINKQTFLANIKQYKNKFVSRETNSENTNQIKLTLSEIHLFFRAIIFGFLFIGLFDHYLWDIWQGQVLFWLTAGILFGIILCSSNKKFDIFLLKILNKDLDNIMLDNKTSNNKTASIITFLNLFIFIGILQASIGITQFFKQSSLGLFWLKESLINEKIAGVAKIIINHHLFIRAYGLFPHPNIFAGFLFFLIMLTSLYKNLFHVKQIKTFINDTTTIEAGKKMAFCNNIFPFLNKLLEKIFKLVSRETNNENVRFKFILKSFFINIALAIEVFALILSFSKSAIIALSLSIIYINVSRETFSVKYKNAILVTIKKFKSILTLATLFGISFLILYFLKIDFYALFIKSLNERYLYFSIAKQTILDNPVFGIGEGQFIINSAKIFPNLEIWQYQPVHNIFLLIWSEWGIAGLSLFILFLWKLLYIKPINKLNDNNSVK